MTPAEKELLEIAMSLKLDSGDGAVDILMPYVNALREERCPSALYERALAAETKRAAANDEFRIEANELRLNYPEEMVDAAFSKARRELRGNR